MKKQKYSSKPNNNGGKHVATDCNAKKAGSHVVVSRAKLIPWYVALIPSAIVFVVAWLSLSCYPQTEVMMEHMDFYVNTHEFFANSLSDYPGVNSLVTAWLLQFFGDSQTGATIESLLLAIATFLVSILPVAWFRKKGEWQKRWLNPLVLLAVVPAFGMLLRFLHKPGLTIQAIFFYGTLCLMGWVKGSRHRSLDIILTVVVGFCSFWLVSFPVMAVLMLAITLLDLVATKQRGEKLGKNTLLKCICLVLPIVFIPLTATAIKISSSVLGFIPVENRWWHISNTEDRPLLFLVLLIVPMILMFVCRIKKMWYQVLTEFVCAVIVGLLCYKNISSNEEYQLSETVYRYSDYAENHRWQELLDEIRQNGELTNTFYVQMALMAEAQMGTLPDNLFSYSINTPELFCPRFEKEPFATDFCRIFYRDLDVVDEAFHQAFEYGTKISPKHGFCLASLRHMAEYSVKIGDKKLADKYLSLLELTSCHSDFVKQQQQILRKTSTKRYPQRSNDFIRAFHFNSEMAHLLDYNCNNKVARDYLLCGLLLAKNLEIFKTVLLDFAGDYKNKPLPKAYAEAAAMINHLKPGILTAEITYPAEYDKQFEQFMKLHNSQQDDSAFQGTFWYYYVYAQIPSLSDWQKAGQSATS